MKNNIPHPVWLAEDVYIIGGGPSLKDFNWSLLERLNTVGCNDAYRLGSAICKVNIFGDVKWIRHHIKYHKEVLAAYQGTMYGALSNAHRFESEHFLYIKQYASGLHTDGIGWNCNTGAAAINLAILLGAARIFLLGFDMKRTKTDSNWHSNALDKNPDTVYKKFIQWFPMLVQDWKAKFSKIEIFNVTDDSDLNCFPKISAKDFWDGKTNIQTSYAAL